MKNIYIANFPGIPNSYFYDLHSVRDELARPFIYLREALEQKGFLIHFLQPTSSLENVAALFSCCHLSPWIVSLFQKVPKDKRFLLLTEPPVVAPALYRPEIAQFFGTIFTMFDELLDQKTFFKFHHNQCRERKTSPIPPFEEKKFSVMIQTNVEHHKHSHELYSERHKTVLACPNPNDLDVYGFGWEKYPNAKGRLTQDKLLILKNYKYAFCYENMRNQKGYITERLFDAMYAGCVPVYWGADNIEEYVPKNCFIDRRHFITNEEMFTFLQKIDQKRYQLYLDAIDAYLLSEKHRRHFSSTSFSKDLTQVLFQRLL